MHQLEEKLGPSSYEEPDLVFATRKDTPLDPQNIVNRHFKPLLRRAGLPEIRWARSQAHLRHSASGAKRPPEIGPASHGARKHYHDFRPLLAPDTLYGKARYRGYGRGLGIESTAALLLPQHSAGAAESCDLPADGRVTDGARTRDLRSHNPMLCQLSYGHQVHARFYQEKAGGKTMSI